MGRVVWVVWVGCVLSVGCTASVPKPSPAKPEPVEGFEGCSKHVKAKATLRELSVGNALMSNETKMADASSHTQAVDDMKGWFPALEAEGVRPMLVTPMGRPEEDGAALGVVALTKGGSINKEGVATEYTWFTLDCTQSPAQVWGEPQQVSQGNAMQFRGTEWTVLPNGTVQTSVRLMWSLPDIMEMYIPVFVFHTAKQRAPVFLGSTENIGAQFLSMADHAPGEYARSDPFAGTGWYPWEDSTSFVFLNMHGISGPGEEPGAWTELVQLQAVATMGAPYKELAEGGPEDIVWVWLVAGDRPKGCGEAVFCMPMRGEPYGSFNWRNGSEFHWSVGAWGSLERAVKDLQDAGVDWKQGAFLTTLDAYSWKELQGDPSSALKVPEGARILHELPFRLKEK